MTTPRSLLARRYDDGSPVRVTLEASGHATLGPAGDHGEIGLPRVELPWLAPGFLDIQINGRWGVSFSDPDLTEEQCAEVILSQREAGTTRLLPTLITAPIADMVRALETIARACRRWPEVDAMVAGIHLEGPFISPEDGDRGAHPLEAVLDPDPHLFQTLHEASGRRVKLMTLAPERPGGLGLIQSLAAARITAAIGHTSAGPEMIERAVSAGARLATHLGNGIRTPLPRHPNPIWTMAGDDRLSASLIADGAHLDDATLRVLVRAKTPARVVLVSDASPLADAQPGTYGPWQVNEDGRITVAGTAYLAGANRPLDFDLAHLVAVAGLSLREAVATLTTNPAHLLGLPTEGLDACTSTLDSFVLLEHAEPVDEARRPAGSDPSTPRLRRLATYCRGRWDGPDSLPGS